MDYLSRIYYMYLNVHRDTCSYYIIPRLYSLVYEPLAYSCLMCEIWGRWNVSEEYIFCEQHFKLKVFARNSGIKGIIKQCIVYAILQKLLQLSYMR